MSLTVERVFDIEPLITAEEREWQLKARKIAAEVIAPVVDDDFETKFFRKEIIGKLAERRQARRGTKRSGVPAQGARASAFTSFRRDKPSGKYGTGASMPRITARPVRVVVSCQSHVASAKWDGTGGQPARLRLL